MCPRLICRGHYLFLTLGLVAVYKGHNVFDVIIHPICESNESFEAQKYN